MEALNYILMSIHFKIEVNEIGVPSFFSRTLYKMRRGDFIPNTTEQATEEGYYVVYNSEHSASFLGSQNALENYLNLLEANGFQRLK